MKIIAYGMPAPQGSKRGFVNRKTGGVILVESSDKVKPWREAVKYAAIEVRDGGLPLTGPLQVSMVFTFARPAGHFGSGKNAGLVRAGAPSHPHGRPDLSKLARSTEDALTDARAFEDDARIVEYSRLAKVYIGGDADALDAPGVKIEILEMKSAPLFADALEGETG